MKKKIIIIILNLLYCSCFSQTDRKIFIADSITREPVEYACIVFADTVGGTYSNSKGIFYISQNIGQIEISSIGYYSKTINIEKIIDTVFISPQVYEISETKVLPTKKKRKSIELGYANENSIYFIGFISGEEIAVYIPAGNENNTFRLIKQVIIRERNALQRQLDIQRREYTGIFKINFYEATENKEIGELINTEDIVFTSEILKSKTKLDVGKYNIYMPENGIFVGVEFMETINDEQEEIIKIKKLKMRALPNIFIRVSWKIPNSIVYEKKKFRYSDNNWHRIDKNNERIKEIKSLDKNLKEDDFYTPLFSVVLE
ncbi:MAG: carboxypeptidase-like regulatory domain-containing protein [Prevotellaceae bacterium]|jgi:hypothetical protein|nr:carboxypeptidase-like regulatory domain-containing protein [Prevotellaceae bacterium]